MIQPPQKFIKIRQLPEMLAYRQTDTQSQKHNFVGGSYHGEVKISTG